MSIPVEYESILRNLESATKRGQMAWVQDDFGGFSVRIDDSKFKIWVGTDEDSGVDFVALALQDISGKSLDSWSVDRGEVGYSRMWELFSDIRRKATGVVDKLKSLEQLLSTRFGSRP